LARTAATQGRQIIVATHSSDVVQGALDEGVDVSVARVSRDKDSTSVSLLDSGELRALWRHPLLSSASAIDGLFHRGVVVSESDSDSRVYDAGTRQLERRRLLVESPDLYYVQGGGKGELGTLAEAYYKLHVPVAVIADLDLLRESGLVDRVLRALGQDPAHTRGLYGAVAKALADGGGLLTAAEVARQLSETSTRIAQSDRVTTADRGEVEDLVSQALPWARAKCDGIGMLSGDDATKAKELLATWAAVGLHLVPSGELESLWTGRGRRDKRAWSRAALEHLAGDNIIPQLDELLRQVLQHLGIAFGATPEATGPSQDRESN